MPALLLAAALLIGPSTPEACVRAENTPEMNACYSALATAETERMQAYLAVAVDRVTAQAGTVADELQADQKAWEGYADLACGTVYSHWRTGTIRTVRALSCRRDLTRERSRHLWREYIDHVDRTPAPLPEPVDYAARTPTEN
jgi:uncharacterized protein YecT (DUF1311 family)